MSLSSSPVKALANIKKIHESDNVVAWQHQEEHELWSWLRENRLLSFTLCKWKDAFIKILWQVLSGKEKPWATEEIRSCVNVWKFCRKTFGRKRLLRKARSQSFPFFTYSDARKTIRNETFEWVSFHIIKRWITIVCTYTQNEIGDAVLR